MRNLLVCLMCDWKWLSKLQNGPLKCPRCQSWNWNDPTKMNEHREVKNRWPQIQAVEIGQSVSIDFPRLVNGARDESGIKSLLSAVCQEERRKFKKFHKHRTPLQLHLKRTQ